jgi:phospholipid/cholesterol/gamma-HCH transport system substrate-binding protein
MSTRDRFRLRMLGIAAFTTAAAAVFIYFLALSGVQLAPGPSYTLHAQVPSAVDLAQDADVREAGVKIGSVRGIATEGDHALITMSLQRRYAPVYRDAQALVADKSLAGENYIDLDRGDPAAGPLPAGATLPLSQDPEAVQLDQILSTFDRQRRSDVQQILDVLGEGLGGQGANLNEFLGGAGDLVDNAAPVASVLATDRHSVASLIDDFGAVARALGQRAQDIQTLVHDARLAAQAVASRQPQLEASLAALPAFLGQAHTSISDLGAFSSSATPVIGNLASATQTLIPAIQELAPAASATRQAIGALGRFARAAIPAADRLRRFAPATTAMLPALEAVLRQANPLLAYLAPYALDLGSFFSGTRAATEVTDSTGHYGRLDVGFNQSSLAGALTPQQTQALNALLQSGLLNKVSTLNQNPYPAARGAQNPTPFSGEYPHLQPDPPYTTSKAR